MTVSERRERIMDMFQSTNFVTITDIVTRFDISNETARRDLDYLQNQKLIQRVYGGAILVSQGNTTLHVPNSQNLSAIGKAAAQLVKPGEAIFLGNGSTTLQIARHLRNRSNITVITNSLPNANMLVGTAVNLITLGGIINHNELDIGGELAVDCANQFYCNKAFFGCGGITSNLDIMDHNTNGSPLHAHFIQRSSQHILVTASHKFDSPAFIKACSMRDVDVLITDTQLSADYARRVRDLGVELIQVELDNDDFAM